MLRYLIEVAVVSIITKYDLARLDQSVSPARDGQPAAVLENLQNGAIGAN